LEENPGGDPSKPFNTTFLLLISSMNLSKEKRVMLLAAREAEKVLKKYYGRKVEVKIKPNKSLVAVADLEADKAIKRTIKKYFPNHSILTEESGFEDNNSDYKWVIDPIDGTHNFLRGIPIFGTSIALEYKNEVILGILNFPMLKLRAIAEKNRGAFLNGKKLKVSAKRDIDHSFILMEFSYANRKEKIGFLEKLIHEAIDIRNFGSAIYHLLLIACGKCDGFIVLTTQEWDVAAGFLLVEEAGGKITNLHGQKWDFHDTRYIISNGKIHNKLLEFVKK